MINQDEKYENAKKERQKYVDLVLNSSSPKKIVVAGPGTGKTYLFKEALKGKRNPLTLTFINSLVEDLSLDLYGISDVKTLHSFALNQLTTKTEKIKIFPKLHSVIEEDAKILLNKDVDFDSLFHDRDDTNPHLDFYNKRRKYYMYYSFSDIIFDLVKHYENDKSKIPSYELVVVDEFQDFSILEVSLIDLLSEKSPVLLVGDDDQALYDFKSASPDQIRKRYGIENTEYESFSLPYCSRCTFVIVEAVNDITSTASANGYLNSRLTKSFKYFEDKNKDNESNRNSKIVYAQYYDNQIPWYIQKQISKIAEKENDKFSVLIISPFKKQSRVIVTALEKRGFKNIDSIVKKNGKELKLLDGLKILFKDNKNNLGWRIVLKFLLKQKEFEECLRKTNDNEAMKIFEISDKDLVNKVKKVLKHLKAIEKKKHVDESNLDEVLRLIGYDSCEIKKKYLGTDIIPSLIPSSRSSFKQGLKKIPIKATTIQSSKGLDADYVFITHFDDQYFIKNKDKSLISDHDISNFLVALTRARRRVFLISSKKNQEPTFLKWIEKHRISKE